MIGRITVLCGVLIGAAGSALGQGARPYDGIQAGLDAWKLAEEQRRGAVSDQLRLNDDLKFWSGLPTSRGETILYYDEPYPAYGGYGPYGYGWGGYYASPYGGPVVGYTRPLVRQPIGRTEVQTGPNRWESHPIYDPPLSDMRPSPPVDSPWLYGTPYEPPSQEVPVDEGLTTDLIPPEAPASPQDPAPADVVPRESVPREDRVPPPPKPGRIREY